MPFTAPAAPVRPGSLPTPVRPAPPSLAQRGSTRNTTPRRSGPPRKPDGPKAEHEILFQRFFKSVGPRTYAAQVKRATNGNHYVVLTEGQRDRKTGDVRKTRLFVFGEDFDAFFNLLRETVGFVKANPLPPDVKAKRQRFWDKQAAGARASTGKPLPRRPIPVRSAAGMAASTRSR